MSLAQWISLLSMNLLGAASPGPDVIVIMRMAMRSRRHGLASVAGICCGVLMWTTLTVAGAAAVLVAYPALLGGVQLVGGLVIVWIGYQMASSGWRERHAPIASIEQVEKSLGSLKSSFRLGLATNLSNPKIVIFLAAIVAPLLPESPGVGLAAAVIVAMTVSVGVYFSALSYFLSTQRLRRKLLKAGPAIDIGAGLLFCLIGTSLAVSGIQSVVTGG